MDRDGLLKYKVNTLLLIYWSNCLFPLDFNSKLRTLLEERKFKLGLFLLV